jgi:periplasmic protein TonB
MNENMKKLLLFACLFFSASVLMAQNTKDSIAALQDISIWDVAENDPMFPGGEMAMLNFLVRNLKYPASAVDNGIQGKVFLRFVVEKDGSLTNIEVIRSLEKDCDNEAIRVVKLMPKWIPADHHGKKVRVRFVLPITFKLSEEKIK